MSALVCGACGTPAVPGARFCFNCGAPLERAPELGEASAERRWVTVLFGDLSDFTAWAEDLDPERVGVVTDRLLAELARAVADVGGHVDKLTGDGIMAVFGAPTAHEDDPERAVRAAAQMQTAVRRLVEEESGGGRRLGLRVGLNTGEVLAGVQAHMSYTVVGDTVNTASRLADAASVGGVYAGRDTALATMPIASWRALAPLRLKGKREPVQAYELVGLRPPGSVRLGLGEEAPFVGREAELGLLVGRLTSVRERGVPGSVVVTGDAGVGKTRLAAELSRLAAELPRARVLWGRCTPYGAGRTLAPMAEWVRTACGVQEGESAEEAVERVRRTVARLEHPTHRQSVPANVADRLLGLLGLAARTPPAPRESAAPGAGSEPGDPVLDAVLALLQGLAAGGPLVLVLDDLQWAAPEMVTALAYVTGRLSGPVMVVCVGRSDVVSGEGLDPDWWRGLPAPELLPLAPLDEPAADRLLRAYLGGAELDAAARHLLLERSQGNPFFLAEVLHLLVDRGLLRREDDGWHLEGELPSEVLPAGVQAVLAARFDGLDATSKAVLRGAAVVGVRFSAAALLAIDPRPVGEVQAALETLVARGILASTGEDSASGPQFAFIHALARDVVYAAIPKAERARQHAAVAEWAEADLPGSRADVDSFVAAQAERAVALAVEMRLAPGDFAWRARALGFAALCRLGQVALSRDDDERAEVALNRALELVDGGVGESARLFALTARADARTAMRRFDEAEHDLAEPLRSADLGIRAGALVVLGEIRRLRGEEEPARQALVQALAMASDAGVDRITGEALRQLGMLDYFAGRLRQAEQRMRQALELSERVGDEHGVGWALQHLAWSATTRGDWDVAEQALGRAATVFGALDDEGGLSWCAGTEAFIRLLQGRFVEARTLAQGLMTVGEEMGEHWGVAACRTIDAYAAAELGDVAAARAEAARAHDDFVTLVDTWGQAMALIAEGVAARNAGKADRALEILQDAVTCSVEAKHPTTEALALSSLGYCHLDRGDPLEAAHAARAALETLGALDLEERALVGPKVLLAMALRQQGRAEEALPLLEEAARSTEEPSLIFPRRQALAHYAGALLELGRAADALATTNRALAVPAEDVRSRVVALRVLANCYQASGDLPAARYAVRQALALARSTEMEAEVPATERSAANLSVA